MAWHCLTLAKVRTDNGRGPELSERYTLAGDGTFQTYEVEGESTFGAPVADPAQDPPLPVPDYATNYRRPGAA